MLGCYLPRALEESSEYQEVVATRLQAARADMREPDSYEWELLTRDYPGVPLKHFVDHWVRYEATKHDADCPTAAHEPFFLDFIGRRSHNTINSFEPE